MQKACFLTARLISDIEIRVNNTTSKAYRLDRSALLLLAQTGFLTMVACMFGNVLLWIHLESHQMILFMRKPTFSPNENNNGAYQLHTFARSDQCIYEPRREKTGSLHMRKQRRRSASR